MKKNRAQKTDSLYFFLFALLSLIYFNEVFSGGVIPLSVDAGLQNYPLRAFYSEIIRDGSFPLWNPYEFAGLPYVGAMQTGALYPLNLLFYFLLPAYHAFTINFILHFAMAGFFTFIYLREEGLGRFPSLVGGTVFAFSGFMATHKPHTAILNSAVWLPLIIMFASRLRKVPCLKNSLLLSLALAVQILAGNFQICFYTYLVLALFTVNALFGLKKHDRVNFLLLSALSIALAFVLGLPQILPTLELNGLSMRPVMRDTLGTIFFREFYVYLKTLPGLLFPGLYIDANSKRFLVTASDAMLAFVGVFPLLIAVAVFLMGVGRSGMVRFWGLVGALGLLLSVANDTPLGNLLFHMPGYNIFRSHGRNIFEFSFAVSVLCAIGLDSVVAARRSLKPLIVLLSGVIAVSLLALFYIQFTGTQELKGIIRLGNPAVYVSLLFMLGYLLWAVAYQKRPGQVLLAGLFLLVFSEAYVMLSSFESGWSRSDEVIDRCEERGYSAVRRTDGAVPPRTFMVSSSTTDLYGVPCRVASISAYDQLIPRDFAVLLDLEPLGYSRYWQHLLRNNTLLSALNVEYLFVPSGAEEAMTSVMTVDSAPRRGERILDPSRYILSEPGRSRQNSILLARNTGEGTYVFCLNARALEDDASLRLDVFADPDQQLRYASTPLNIYPGIIGRAVTEYCRVIHNMNTGKVTLSLISPLFRAVEIGDISIQKIAGYGPPPLGVNGSVYEKVMEVEDHKVFHNRNALPRAYPVSELITVRNIYEAKNLLDLNEIDPSRQALMYAHDMQGLAHSKKFGKGKVTIADYGLHEIIIKADFQGEGFLVLAEQYFPGWRAYVDGEETEIYRVNGVLRGVIVPGGEHEVAFKYRPMRFFTALVLSLALLVSITAALALKTLKGQDDSEE